MNRRAFPAIVVARLRAERRAIAFICAATAVVGFVQPRGLAGPIFFCGLLGILIALLQGPGRRLHLDLCEQSAPLFGRELARAKAAIPCIAATLALAIYWAAQFVSGFPPSPSAPALAFAAVIATTLVALSATIRTGPPRALYIVLACSVNASAYVLATSAKGAPIEPLFCALVAFFALRQYGEALARYDPVEEAPDL